MEPELLEKLLKLLSHREIALIERFREEESRIAENVADWNIRAKGVRTIKVEVNYHFNENRELEKVTVVSAAKVQSHNPALLKNVTFNEHQKRFGELQEVQRPLLAAVAEGVQVQ